jgi:histidinol-phosphate aminotransferase
MGFTFPESKTNFVFAKPPKMSAKDLFMALRERKIFVRYFNKPRINEYLRITIGTDEQMAKVVAAMKEILG